ncbi:unnamed protein product [Linum trigynum]|uniref:Uncharacterized protein n=1 Tax=Linum trigynum TaxID=586398 RepID=A0AAV2E7X5_9ROSI
MRATSFPQPLVAKPHRREDLLSLAQIKKSPEEVPMSIPGEISGKIECSSSGIDKVAIDFNDDIVSFLDRGLNFNSRLQSHSSSVLFLQRLQQRNFLLTVGEDEQLASEQSFTCLQVFDLDEASQQHEGTRDHEEVILHG